MSDPRRRGGDEADAEGAVIVGRNPVREALERDDVTIEKVLLQQGIGGKPVDEIRRLATRQGIPVQVVPPQKLGHLAAGAAHQGIAALISPVAYVDLDDMLSTIAPGIEAVAREKPIIVLLDQIEDPHNYGAILRSAVAAGARGVIVPRHHMAPLSAVAVKASAGAALRVPIARVVNLAEAMEQLKERGYWLAGAAGEATVSVWDMDWDRPLGIVIGSEGRGLRERVAAACDYLVSIPMPGPVQSLNASVAAGIVLFAALRGRQP